MREELLLLLLVPFLNLSFKFNYEFSGVHSTKRILFIEIRDAETHLAEKHVSTQS